MMPNNKIKAFFRDKGFYLVLAVCIVGASAAAWITANKTLDSIEENNRKIVEQNVSGEEKPWKESTPEVIPQIPTAPVQEPQDDIRKSPSSATSQPQLSSSSSSLQDSGESSASQSVEQRLEQSPYTLPMAVLAVIQPYSNGELVKNKTLNVWRTHDGVDLKADKGSNVMAVSDGVVTAMGTDPLWGGFIEIKHPDGCISSYSGVVAEKNLKKGDNVKGGQKLGVLGDIPAEITMEPHLHFSMKRQNSFVDPGLYLKLKADQAASAVE